MSLRIGGQAIKPKRRREIYENVVSISRPSGSYYVMMTLSAIIAAYGLLIGSAAVVIGAMLVAPLMGPIFGIALGLTSGNRRLLWSSLQSEMYGVALTVAVAALIGLLPFRGPIGEEWLVRTQPTLHDLAIALAAGLAGAYALIDERLSPSLPGVAIAVAVVPPLAACGLSIAAMRWDMAGGAMMLFIANLFAIQIAGAIVFTLFGMLRGGRNRYDDEEEAHFWHFLRRFWISFAVLGVIAWFMTSTLMSLTAERRISRTIETTLSEQVGATLGARLSDYDLEQMPDAVRVTARVLTPRAFASEDVAALEEELERVLDRDVHLIVRSMISRDVDRRGAVFASAEEVRTKAEEEKRVEFLSLASRVISDRLTFIPGAELVDVGRSRPNGTITINAVVRAPEPITPEQVAQIEKALRDELDVRLDLVVSTSLTRDATSAGYLNDEELPPGQASLLSAARATLESWLARNLDGTRLIELELDATGEEWALTAHLLTPRSISGDEAAEMQRELLQELPSELRLKLRYSLGGEFIPAETSTLEP